MGFANLLQSLDKTVNLVLGKKNLPSWAKKFPGWEKISSSLTRNFVITLKSAVGNVEKVSYYVEGDDLHLVVRPYPQSPPFTKEQVRFQEGSGDYDLVFVLGVERLEDLGHLYTENRELFSKTPLVNISLKENERFGKLNLVFSQTSSFSEVVVQFADDFGGKLDSQSASNLLTGIFWATKNFSSPRVNAASFEAAAFCLRQGGKRLSLEEKEEKKEFLPKKEEKVETVPKEEVKHDWLKPKIYQGGELKTL